MAALPIQACKICCDQNVAALLDCGQQPICNRFLAHPNDEEYTHPMVIGQCQACGMIQISNPVPAAEVLPRHQWITYLEPEGHLDDLAEIISALPGLTEDSTVCGISFKDDSLVERLSRRGFKNTWRLDPERDLGIVEPGAGDETIQDRLTPEAALRIAGIRGKADVVIVRHILEHAHQPISFLQALKNLLSPNGFIVAEAPDEARSIEEGDVSILWEEHTLYFTPETFKSALTFGGLSGVRFEQVHYAEEDTVVGIVQPNDQLKPAVPEAAALEKEIRRARNYAEDVEAQRVKVGKFLSNHQENKGKVAVFGAGHRSIAYINLLGLKDYLALVADDNANKLGLFMPGSRIPILASSALVSEDIKLCLLAVKTEFEDKIVNSNQSFLEQGGVFSSIAQSSNRAIRA